MTATPARSQALVAITEGPQPGADAPKRRVRRRAGIAERGSGMLNRALLGLVVVAAVVAGLGGWGATAQLSGAVIASGRLVVDGNVRRVQHISGGIVGSVVVRNGQRVERDQVLLTIDDGKARTDAAINAARMIQLESARSRILAERDNRSEMVLPSHVDMTDAATSRAFDEERRLLDARRRGWRTQQMRLGERISQIRKEIEATGAQRAAKEREIELIRQELGLVEDLHKRQLANIVRLIGMKREIARFEGEKGALVAQIARAESHIAEIELQRAELEQRIISDGQNQLREIDSELAELRERRTAASETVERAQVRAPVSGIVHELAVHAAGSVIRPGDTIMTIVPEGDALTAEVRITPNSIDQIRAGQPALIRFGAFSREQTAEIRGRVLYVGADVSREPASGQDYYTARIAVDAGDLAGAGLQLAPGMPLDAFIETEARTAMSYILKPLSDHFTRAMRER